jgi:hypothetical protein
VPTVGAASGRTVSTDSCFACVDGTILKKSPDFTAMKPLTSRICSSTGSSELTGSLSVVWIETRPRTEGPTM